jgi:hypothetical protein
MSHAFTQNRSLEIHSGSDPKKTPHGISTAMLTAVWTAHLVQHKCVHLPVYTVLDTDSTMKQMNCLYVANSEWHEARSHLSLHGVTARSLCAHKPQLTRMFCLQNHSTKGLHAPFSLPVHNSGLSSEMVVMLRYWLHLQHPSAPAVSMVLTGPDFSGNDPASLYCPVHGTLIPNWLCWPLARIRTFLWGMVPDYVHVGSANSQYIWVAFVEPWAVFRPLHIPINLIPTATVWQYRLHKRVRYFCANMWHSLHLYILNVYLRCTLKLSMRVSSSVQRWNLQPCNIVASRPCSLQKDATVSLFRWQNGKTPTVVALSERADLKSVQGGCPFSTYPKHRTPKPKYQPHIHKL